MQTPPPQHADSASATCRLRLRNMQTPPPQHADSASATCRLRLRNMQTPSATCRLRLRNSLIISRLDYCNSLLTGPPRRWLSPLQSILNTAARLIHLSNRSISATPPLPIPPLASTQCPPPPSGNPSTGLHSVSSTPSLPIPPLTSTQCPPPPLPIP
ncbi:unnamed protein product, partial [Staurois parvus]